MSNPTAQKVINDPKTDKYRLIFLPEDVFNILNSAPGKKFYYDRFKELEVDHFSVNDKKIIFINDKHREFLRLKARTGESI